MEHRQESSMEIHVELGALPSFKSNWYLYRRQRRSLPDSQESILSLLTTLSNDRFEDFLVDQYLVMRDDVGKNSHDTSFSKSRSRSFQ